MVEIDMVRNNLQIDPHLTIWGWEIPIYLFLGGLAAGIMILWPLLRMQHEGSDDARWARWLPFAAPIAISIGMLALFIDLAHREYVFRFYLTFRPSSPMSWGAWILIGIYPATVLLGLSGMTRDEVEAVASWGPFRLPGLGALVRWGRTLAETHRRTVYWTNIVLGIGLGAYTGLLLGTLAARPAWNSTVLALLFLVSGLSTGAAFMMLFPVTREDHHLLRKWDVAAIVTELVLIFLFLLSLGASGGARGHEAVALFLGGPYTAAFWTLVFAVGLATPLALEVLEARRKLQPTLAAPMLILAGGLALRWILVLAGQAV